jgi:hypothetical protein
MRCATKTRDIQSLLSSNTTIHYVLREGRCSFIDDGQSALVKEVLSPDAMCNKNS